VTLSLSVYEQKTGAFGSVICSSSPAVAARCQWARARVGVVCTQNVTNPALGKAALDGLAHGESAASALAAALAADDYPAYRQLVVVGPAGRPALYSGSRSLGIHAECAGAHEAAAGNLLASAEVIRAFRDGYIASDASYLEGRLLDGLDQALRAGGEASPVRSAGLVVVGDLPWPVTDLRVDWHDEPAAELRSLWEIWQPVKAEYLVRALEPGNAPQS